MTARRLKDHAPGTIRTVAEIVRRELLSVGRAAEDIEALEMMSLVALLAPAALQEATRYPTTQPNGV